MYVYADMLVLLNFFMNTIILLGTAQIVGVSLRWRRVIGSALFGALVSLAMLLPQGAFLKLPLSKLMLSLLMVGMVFYPVSWRRWPLVFSVFYLVSFILGGTVLAAFYFMDTSSYLTNGVFTTQHASWVTLISAVVVLIVWGHWLWGRLSTRLWQQKYIVPIQIGMSGRLVRISALMDSGNCLRDPISRIPVAVAEYNHIKALLPMEVSALLDGVAEEEWINLLQRLPSEMAARLHIIPFSSIGRQRGLLIGFRPDFLEIEEDGCKRRISAVIVAMCHRHLSNRGEYHALLHPEIIHNALEQQKEAS